MKGHYYYLLMNKLFEEVYFENVYLGEKEEFKPKKSLWSRYGLNPVNEECYQTQTIKIFNDTNSK